MNSKMDDTCGHFDKKIVLKRRATSLPALANDSIKKRLRGNRSHTSLTDLNDDCLLAIFENLNRIDICHVQNVCKRFDSVAETAFHSRLKRNKNWAKIGMRESRSETRRILYKFGHLFEKLIINGTCDSDILQRLTQIKELHLQQVNIDWKMICVLHAAEKLSLLFMTKCKFVSNNGGKRRRVSAKDLHTTITPLNHLIIREQPPPVHVFNKMLQYNKRIQGLGLPLNVSKKFLSHIVNHGQQLTRLHLYAKNSNRMEILKILGDLKNLRELVIDGCDECTMSAKPLVKHIQERALKITNLYLYELTFDEETLEIIGEMKTLRLLTLTGAFYFDKTMLVPLVASLPLLISVTFSFLRCVSHNCRVRNVYFDTLNDIVAAAGKELNSLTLDGVREATIDEKGYAKLLKTIKNGNRKKRLSITIIGCTATTSFDVPMHVQKADEKSLRIAYIADTDCKCHSCIEN